MKADLEAIYHTSGSVITPLNKINVLDMNTVSYLAFAMHMQGNFLVTSCTVIKYQEFVPFP